MTNPHHTTTYVEINVSDLSAAKDFYGAALGWQFNDYGPTYAGIRSGGAEGEVGGIAGGGSGGTGGPVVFVESGDVDESARSVVAAGGVLDEEIYAYPGGRRFTFTDPDGNRLGVFESTH